MSKFKVGDKIIANKEADKFYGCGRSGWKGVVTKIGKYFFVAECIETKIEHGNLSEKHFDLLEPQPKTLETLEVGDYVVDESELYYKILAVLGGEGDYKTYIISCRALEKDCNANKKVFEVFTAYDLKERNFKLETPPVEKFTDEEKQAMELLKKNGYKIDKE